MVLKATGTLDFFPDNETRKHHTQSAWKRHALIVTDCDLERYYAWLLERRFNLKLNSTLRGTHISFIADRYNDEARWKEVAEHFHGRPIDFYYENEPRTNGKHWWLRVHSPDSESIRVLLGLDPHPYFDLHLTMGYVNDKNLAHSLYIMGVCKRYGFMDPMPRRPLSEHEVVNTEC